MLLSTVSNAQEKFYHNISNTTDPAVIFDNPAILSFLKNNTFIGGTDIYHVGLEGTGFKRGQFGIGYKIPDAADVGLTGYYFTSNIYRNTEISGMVSRSPAKFIPL